MSMRNVGFPQKQGLYDPEFEHDNCGIGFLAQMKGRKSHKLVEDALLMLENLEHRGGQGDEINTGDGAGILVQLPDRFLEKCSLLKFRHQEHMQLGCYFCREQRQHEKRANKKWKLCLQKNR